MQRRRPLPGDRRRQRNLDHRRSTAEVYAGPTSATTTCSSRAKPGTLTCLDADDGEKRWQFQDRGAAALHADDRRRAMCCWPAATASCTDRRRDRQGNRHGGDRRPDRRHGGHARATASISAPKAARSTPSTRRPATKQPAVAWTYRDPERGQPIRSAAAVTDKLVVYGSQGKAIYGLDPATGELKWKLPTRSRVDSSPVIAGDRVVAATERGVLYVLDAATGDVKWQYDAGGSFTASPVVVDGRIILGNTRRHAVLLRREGKARDNHRGTEKQKIIRQDDRIGRISEDDNSALMRLLILSIRDLCDLCRKKCRRDVHQHHQNRSR